MVFGNKNKFKLLYKQFRKLKKNVQNSKKLLEFKKQNCEKLAQNYKQKSQRYYKYKQVDPNQDILFQPIKQGFLHKKSFQSDFFAKKILESLYKSNSKIKAPEQFLIFKLLQLNENTKKKKMEAITPVVTEDIVAYLLRNVNKKGQFSKVYKLIASETNLIAAWLEIANIPGIFTKKKLNSTNKPKIFAKLPLKWFKKTSELLALGKYNYKALRVVNVKKINKFRKLILINPHDIIVRKAFQRVLNVAFEGYFEWEKTDKKLFHSYYPGKSDFNQIFKKISHNEYWVKKYKIKPIFSSMSYGFSLRKGIHSAIRTIKNSWYFNLSASYGVSKSFDSANVSILGETLQKYFNDEQMIEQIKKMLNMQMAYTKDSALDILQDNILLPLLFNIYLHPLDEFMHKIIENVATIDKERLNFKNKAAQKSQKLTNQSRIVTFLNGKITPARIYFARFMNEFLFGFFMPRNQIKSIIESIVAFSTNNLKLKIFQKNLKHAFCDKVSFAGFNIQIMSAKDSKHLTKNPLEAYQKHKNMVIRRGIQEHEKFLKMVEWLGRKAISNIVSRDRASRKCIEKKVELKQRIPLLMQQDNWFYNKHKSNKKMELAFKSRMDNQQYRFKKWIKANQDLINSREILELAKITGKEHAEKLKSIRENMSKLIEKMVGAKAETAYVLELKPLKQSSIKINSASKLRLEFEILFPKKKFLEELKHKNIINSRGMPSAVMSKTILLDSEIIDWYTIVVKGLLLYYGCSKNFADLKRLTNWTLRYSLFATLGAKHKKSTKWIIDNFGFDPKVMLGDRIIARFPSAGWINSRRKKYANQILNDKDLLSIINSKYLKLSQRIVSTNKCSLSVCENSPDYIYDIKHLTQI